jgi:hypothetical protein
MPRRIKGKLFYPWDHEMYYGRSRLDPLVNNLRSRGFLVRVKKLGFPGDPYWVIFYHDPSGKTLG